MSIANHSEYMSLALQLAERGRYTVSPNPMVGCVIVNQDRIVGEGYHQFAGGPHAEVIALEEAGANAMGATAYITLEPCCHYGRTPPCSQALIQAGIKKIYIACQDPNPLVCGKGITELQSSGIEVEMGLGAEASKNLNEIFFHFITHKRPFVIAKWAMSLDGKTITDLHDAKSISSEASRNHAHQTRREVDAIIIGANTAREDDPQLTVRFPHITAKQPTRIVISKSGLLPLHLKIFDVTLPGKTLIATTHLDLNLEKHLIQKNVEVLILPKNKCGQIELIDLLDELGKRGITSLLVEGGMTLHHQFMNTDLINKIQVYLAPTVIGLLKQKKTLTTMNVSPIENDLYLTTTWR